MSHNTLISPTSPSAAGSGRACTTASVAAPSQGIEQQRRALQTQVEALRQAGALPSAAAAGQPASAVQWNNWSNG